ncbi:ABC transporter substrate-binding protein [Terribacillus saccharophilus]|uniref:nickel ABC transporter substrate-binding protein n=1 Tax=Terribacillus saccharophilus TaxID=361277 RepID=UPI000BA6CF4B|nr:nickel ABC transporter substrate-binding protein [Terribacillus saccharophilus]PAF20570.1 ABC transporter substrate-binding protein [Terribacillus saccharophilus]PAF35464.1 ABC transporter substrate-binding protein [Terribacillus saccharophilus]PAF40304.1 ABC transporter substrate-binding protein [Terribacillus saccharophilus]
MKKLWVKVLGVAGLLLLLAACTDNADSEGDKKHLTFVYNFATNSLDPNVDSSYVPLRAGLTETLVKLNEETLTIEPWLAESWEGTNEGKEWTIQLREDISFQNGQPMDAEAVKASLERSMKDNVAIQNALKIDSIEADGMTLHISNTQPFPEFVSELVNPNTSIIDVEAGDFVNNPIGTGPFKLDSFTPGSKLELVRNEDYWDETAKLDSVTFSFNEDANARSLALESGNADVVFRPEVESIETLEAKEGIKVESTETFRVHQMTMNLERESLKDVNVRKAVDALINRDEIVDSVLLGYAQSAKGPFPDSLPFAPTYSDRETGAEVAKEYLEKAGYSLQDGKMQKDGEPLEFTLLTYSARADLPLIAQIFQSDAKKLGIDVELRQIEIPEEYMASNRDWDLATYSNLTAPRGDAGYYLNATYHPDGALNFSGANEPELTKIIDQLNVTVDMDKRSELAEEAANYVDENQINSFVLYPDTLVAYDETKVKNWVTTRSEYYMITNQLDVK